MPSKNRSTTLFIDKDSWFHTLHPFTKLSYILLTGVALYAGLFSWEFIVVLLVVNIVVVASTRLLKETTQILWKIMLPLALFMIPIHSFLYPGNETALYSWADMSIYQEGLNFALMTLLRLTVVVLTSLLFVFSTHPADLISAISHKGKSPSLAYLIGSPLLFLGGMRERIETIKAAQQARGLQTGGTLFQRIFSVAR